MTGKVVQLVPKELGDGFHFDADQTLEAMKGKGFSRLLIIGQQEDDSLEIESNCNSGEALFLMKRAEHHIVFGADE
jgi:hypothetical protein